MLISKTVCGGRSFVYRGDSVGDVGVVKQVFENRDYLFGGLPQYAAFDRYRRKLARTPLVLDVGANIGASTVWLATQYPDAVVVAVEPEPKNCALWRQNCGGLTATLIEGGLSSEDGLMFLDDPGRSDWGFRLSHMPTGGPTVRTHGAVEVLREYDDCDPLIAKIDIEGGEADLFRHRTWWLGDFPLVIIELHDWLFPGAAVSRNFFAALSSHNFDFVVLGENAFCFNNSLIGD
jgi:FkbM family methyltransferase